MAPHADLLVHGGEVVSGNGTTRADVAVVDGTIAEVGPDLSGWTAGERVDATGRYVLPGLIDAHNHPYYDEDIDAFSRSAAAGGITTLVPFVAGTAMAGGARRGIVEVAAEFAARVPEVSYLDCGAHAILSPGDDPATSVRGLADMGILSAKVFLAFPGVRMLPDDQVFTVMREVAAVGGTCMVHCENGAVTDLLERELRAAGRTSGEDYLASRPAILEAEAVYRSLALAELAGCPLYVVHISDGEALDLVRRFRRRPGPPVYAETCLHYLWLTGDDQVAMGPKAKISPPCRTAEDRQALWDGIAAGEVDVVATDASGQLAEKKVGEYLAAPYGIPGVEEFVRAFTAGAAARGLDPLPLLAEHLSARPARIFGLSGKGAVAPGKDADLAVYDPEAEWTIRAAGQHGRSDYSLYEGISGRGRITWTCQRGRTVLDGDRLVGGPGQARFLADEGSER